MTNQLGSYYPGDPWLIHMQHFFDCLTKGEQPISDAASQHRSVTPCRLANIAMRLGRTIRCDAESETIKNDPQATAMMSRKARQLEVAA